MKACSRSGNPCRPGLSSSVFRFFTSETLSPDTATHHSTKPGAAGSGCAKPRASMTSSPRCSPTDEGERSGNSTEKRSYPTPTRQSAGKSFDAAALVAVAGSPVISHLAKKGGRYSGEFAAGTCTDSIWVEFGLNTRMHTWCDHEIAHPLD